jgi:glycosyltransferase involved in cell wall biosynthesis
MNGTQMEGDQLKPKASLLLLTYNQESVIKDAALACLSQDYESLEIIFSDDASTDGTFAILEKIAQSYEGRHKLIVRRNRKNSGIGQHYNEAIAASTGDIIITAAGDDISEPTRVSQLIEAWESAGRTPDLLSSHFTIIDSNGRKWDRVQTHDLGRASLSSWSKGHPFTVGATHAFTRRLFDEYGPLGADVWYEDPVILLRALMSGGAITVPQPLVHYRVGGTSQQPTFGSASELKRWHGTQSKRILAGITQMLNDASQKGHYGIVLNTLSDQKRKEEYIYSMIAKKTMIGRFKVFMARADIPAGWKARKLLTFSFPSFAVGFKKAKGKIRRPRKYIGNTDISLLDSAS